MARTKAAARRARGYVASLGLPPILGALSLSAALQIGTSVTGTIAGATDGSTITGNIPGITVNSGARTFSGTPTGSAATIANGLVETLAGATGSPRSTPVTVSAASVSLSITGTPPAATVGSVYSFAPTVAGGSGTKAFSLTGSLPAGLTFDATTGAIGGTPSAAGTVSGLDITVTDSSGSASLGVFSIAVAAAGGAVPGVAATASTVAPSVHYHPHAQAATVTRSGSEILACPDLRGLAGLTATAGTAPVEMTDALGRRFWRFEGAQFAQIAAAFASGTRAFAGVMVGRWHRAVSGNILSLGLNGASPPSTTTGPMSVSMSGSPVQRPLGSLITNATANKQAMIVGSQMQVIATACRSTANGGMRGYVNNQAAFIPQYVTDVASTGAELGRFAAGANGYGVFDLYEMRLWGSGNALADAQMDAEVAAAVSNYAIAPILDTLLLDADSRFQGSNSNVTSGTSIGMVLTAPGAGHIPASYRVVNLGASGNQVPNLVTKRDAANSPFAADMQLTGARHVAYLIGANDGGITSTATTNYPGTSANTVERGDAIATAEKALIQNGGTGYLDRGFTVHRLVEPQVVASPSVSIAQQRVRIREAAFLTDTLSGPGQTFDGKVKRRELPLISVGGATPFNTPANVSAAIGTYMDADGIHPSKLGVELWVSGGDTPANGLGKVLAA